MAVSQFKNASSSAAIMNRDRQKLGTVRTSPLNDVQALRPTLVINVQGLPYQVRTRLEMLVPRRKQIVDAENSQMYS